MATRFGSLVTGSGLHPHSDSSDSSPASGGRFNYGRRSSQSISAAETFGKYLMRGSNSLSALKPSESNQSLGRPLRASDSFTELRTHYIGLRELVSEEYACAAREHDVQIPMVTKEEIIRAYTGMMQILGYKEMPRNLLTIPKEFADKIAMFNDYGLNKIFKEQAQNGNYEAVYLFLNAFNLRGRISKIEDACDAAIEKNQWKILAVLLNHSIKPARLEQMLRTALILKRTQVINILMAPALLKQMPTSFLKQIVHKISDFGNVEQFNALVPIIASKMGTSVEKYICDEVQSLRKLRDMYKSQGAQGSTVINLYTQQLANFERMPLVEQTIQNTIFRATPTQEKYRRLGSGAADSGDDQS